MAVSRETSWNWADALSNQEHASVDSVMPKSFYAGMIWALLFQ
jgi:hypothetical protein